MNGLMTVERQGSRRNHDAKKDSIDSTTCPLTLIATRHRRGSKYDERDDPLSKIRNKEKKKETAAHKYGTFRLVFTFLRFHYASQRPKSPHSPLHYSYIGSGLREASRGASRSSFPIVAVIVSSSPSSDARPSLPLPPHASAAAAATVAVPDAPTTPAT
jgi:hypothetical protein